VAALALRQFVRAKRIELTRRCPCADECACILKLIDLAHHLFVFADERALSDAVDALPVWLGLFRLHRLFDIQPDGIASLLPDLNHVKAHIEVVFGV